MDNEEQLTEMSDRTIGQDTKDVEESALAPEPDAPAENAGETASEEPAVSSDTEEKIVESKKADKAQKADKPKKSNGMSKLFKLVYYPVIAVVALVMMIFSIVDGAYGYKPGAYDGDYYKAVDAHISALAATKRTSMSSEGIGSASSYIVDTLANGGFNRVEEKKNNDESDDEAEVKTITEFASVGNANAPTVTLMTAQPTGALCEEIGAPVLVGNVTNVIAAIPSHKTRAGEDSAAIIITVHYDSRTDTAGAAQNAAFVANVMQTLIEHVESEVDFENDLIVVFTEDLDYAYGSYVFFDAFEGMKNVVSRAKLGLTLDAFGNSGTLALTDASNAGLDYINEYMRVSGTALNASAVIDAIPEGFTSPYAVKAFGDIPALQVAVLGGLDAAQSPLDNIDNLDKSIVYQQAKFVKAYIDRFAYTEKSFGDAEKNVSFFSYFDWGTVGYNAVAAYVFGAIIVALIAASIAVLAVKKTFSLKKLFMALGAQLAVLASTVVCLFAAYFLVAIMVTGFGVIPIHAIIQIRDLNIGVFIAAMILSLAASFGFSSLYKKLMRVTSSDVVRGNAMLFGIAGAVMSFAAPSYSYITSWVGMLMLVVLLVTACLNGKLKDRFGFGFDRLFPYVIPVIVCMPIVMTSVTMLSSLLRLCLLPVVMLPFIGLLGSCVPYLDRTVKVFDGIAKKLPMRTQRVERVVTEKVEDRAKKGKFTEKQVKRVENVKVHVNYKNYFGVSVIAVIGMIVAVITSCFGATFGQTVTATHSYDNAVYNDALVYEWNKSGGSVSQRLVVDDLIAYKYFRYAISDLEWDGENGYYTKSVGTSASEIINQEPSISKNGNVYTVTTFEGPRSHVTIRIPSARSITKITVTDARNNEYVYKFFEQSEITLRFPYGFGGDRTFTMEIEGGSPSSFDYEEYRPVSVNESERAFDNLYEWHQLMLNARLDGDIHNMISGGIVLKMTVSV